MQFERILTKEFPHLFIFEGIELINGKAESVVSVELEFLENGDISIEHVFRLPKFKGIRALPKVIEWIEQTYITKNIVCLPLKQYRTYYEQLGFKVYQQYGEDIYYIKRV